MSNSLRAKARRRKRARLSKFQRDLLSKQHLGDNRRILVTSISRGRPKDLMAKPIIEAAQFLWR